MRRSWLFAAMAAATAATLLAPAEPAGACSVYCPQGELVLELVQIDLVQRNADGNRPEGLTWSDEARLSEYGSFYSDGRSLHVDFEPEEL